MDELENVSQWAILPAKVRYDPNIPPNAKLLFAEIAAKTNLTGYCWASNRFFADRLHLTTDAISGLIKKLEDAGYVTVELAPEQANLQKRKIYITPLAFAFLGVSEINPGGIGKKSDTLHNKENNNKKQRFGAVEIEKPKTMSVEIFAAMADYCGDDGDLMLAYLGWAEMRLKRHKPITSVETVNRANRKMDKCSAGRREYKIGMLHKSTDRTWTGLFPLDPGDDGYPEKETITEERKDLVWF